MKFQRPLLSGGAGLALGASLVGPPLAAAEDLAEAARREKERRAKVQATGPVKSYSSEDLEARHVDQASSMPSVASRRSRGSRRKR